MRLAHLNTLYREAGFTLIELVITIVIVGIIGVGITNFIGRSVQGFADTAERQQLATIAWIVSEKTSREFRDALPNSFRTNQDINSSTGTCVEFIPTVAGTDYLSVPLFSAANTFDVIPFSSYAVSTGDRVAVYPNALAGLYALANPGTISSAITQINDPGTVANSEQIELGAAHQFLTDSPTNRLFIVQDPVMYCFESNRLNRYSGYGYNNAMAASSSAGTPAVVGNRLSSGQFSYAPGNLSRSGIVSISFSVTGNSLDGSPAQQSISQEVHIRNVP